MTTNRQGLLAASNDLGPVWDTANRRRVVSKYLTSNTGAGIGAAADTQQSGNAAAREVKLRTLSRPFAVWILIQTVGISIVMIMSAAIMTARFLV